MCGYNFTLGQHPMTSQSNPWWKGARGEWYFVAQLVLFGLILLAPLAPGQPAWPSAASWAARGLGLLLGLAGFALAAAGVGGPGRKLRPPPPPKDHAGLLEGR